MSSEVAKELFAALCSLELAAQAMPAPEKNARRRDYRSILLAQVDVRARLILQLERDNQAMRVYLGEVAVVHEAELHGDRER